jgi:hypothetical protein
VLPHTARLSKVTIAQDPAADELLGRDPLALRIGMPLDQQVRQRSSGAVGRPVCVAAAVIASE